MPQPSDELRHYRITLADPVRHFRQDAPGWRLAALFIGCLPKILSGIAALVLSFRIIDWIT
jgi:hypothetical protein